ncbi:MAG: hypothetical protein ACR2HQ_11270 [Ilumatobacteraceae bacterium]
MPAREGLSCEKRRNGEVVIRHHGRVAVVLRGRKAAAFLGEAASGDAQARMARLTGNYKRGNESATISEAARMRSAGAARSDRRHSSSRTVRR